MVRERERKRERREGKSSLSLLAPLAAPSRQVRNPARKPRMPGGARAADAAECVARARNRGSGARPKGRGARVRVLSPEEPQSPFSLSPPHPRPLPRSRPLVSSKATTAAALGRPIDRPDGRAPIAKVAARLPREGAARGRAARWRRAQRSGAAAAAAAAGAWRESEAPGVPRLLLPQLGLTLKHLPRPP